MNKKVAVVILNWNGKSFLEQFLPSITNFSNEADIIVADNNSTDDSVSFLKNNYPSIRIIELDDNYGFAGGYNNALKLVDNEYYVLLNSDVEVTENWLKPMVNLLEDNIDVVACQPKIKDYNNKSYYEYAGASGGFIDKYGYPFCRGRIFDTLEKDSGQYNEPSEIFWASGASLFIRSKQYHSIGGLDEFFFAHMEEIDLCWRLKNNGHKIMVCPSSTVYHVGGGTLNKINPRKTFLNFRNSLLTLHKNLPKNKRFIKLFVRMCLDGLAAIKFLIDGKPKHTLAILNSHLAFYKAISQNKLKRKTFVKPNNVGMIEKSIVKEYFLNKHKTFTKLLN
ncbi:glycosyltransferase family 2 protein [Vicingaceae bacterium]|nr:glycosyltransferase family 2 protein [Vicingaceae bacterium]